MYTVRMKANPDDFVVLVPNSWGSDAAEFLRQTHLEVWQEEMRISVGADGGDLSVGVLHASVAIDEPIPELVQLASSSLEPFGGSAVGLLEQHTQIWRIVGSGGVAAASPLARLVTSMMEAGGAGTFLPAIKRLHSPRSVQSITAQLDERALVNVFVSAFDDGEWMRTRGLTAFGFPEVETPLTDGMNAGYYRLMDLAAGMIGQRGPYPSGGRIRLGPHFYRLEEGPRGPDDEIVVNGIHGVQSLLPKEWVIAQE